MGDIQTISFNINNPIQTTSFNLNEGIQYYMCSRVITTWLSDRHGSD